MLDNQNYRHQYFDISPVNTVVRQSLKVLNVDVWWTRPAAVNMKKLTLLNKTTECADLKN